MLSDALSTCKYSDNILFFHANFSRWLKPPTRHYLTMSKTGTMNRGFALGMRKNYTKTDWKARRQDLKYIKTFKKKQLKNHLQPSNLLQLESFSHNWNIISFHLHVLKNFPFLAGYLIRFGHAPEFTPFRRLFQRPAGRLAHRIFRSLSLVSYFSSHQPDIFNHVKNRYNEPRISKKLHKNRL